MGREFRDFMISNKKLIESNLEKLVSNLSGTEFYEPAKHSLLSGGKRLRPILVTLTMELFGEDKEEVLPLALSHELIHTASLIHDDIIDREKYRREVESVQEKWGSGEAILTGDALISIAIELSSRYPARIISSVSRMAYQLASGQKMELSSLEKATEERYLETVKRKTGSMFVSCLYCPALLADATKKNISAVRKFGENLGIFFQLRDDIVDLMDDGSSIPKDFDPPRPTIPVIHAYRRTKDGRKSKILNNWKGLKENPSPSASRRLKQYLVEKGSIAYTKNLKKQYFNRVLNDLRNLPENRYKSYLEEILNSLRENETEFIEEKLFDQG